LFRIAKRALELNPNDLVTANNCASFGLLSSGQHFAATRGEIARRASGGTRLRRDLCLRAACGRQKGRSIADNGDTARRRAAAPPRIAAYYVVLLVENGNFERAHAIISQTRNAPRFSRKSSNFSPLRRANWEARRSNWRSVNAFAGQRNCRPNFSARSDEPA
jgi:Flp pilus assembly protein TadD